jgi:hypothetical protein
MQIKTTIAKMALTKVKNEAIISEDVEQRELFFFFIYSHVHTLFGSFLPPAHLSHPSSPPRLSSRQVLFCPYH